MISLFFRAPAARSWTILHSEIHAKSPFSARRSFENFGMRRYYIFFENHPICELKSSNFSGYHRRPKSLKISRNPRFCENCFKSRNIDCFESNYLNYTSNSDFENKGGQNLKRGDKTWGIPLIVSSNPKTSPIMIITQITLPHHFPTSDLDSGHISTFWTISGTRFSTKSL